MLSEATTTHTKQGFAILFETLSEYESKKKNEENILICISVNLLRIGNNRNKVSTSICLGSR